jgi:hypothetical protein
MLHFLLQLPPAGLPQQAPVLPELPPGPSLDRVRGPVEIPFLETWQIALIALLGLIVAALLGWKLLQRIRTQRNQHVLISPQDAAIAELKSAAELTTDHDEQFAVLSSLALRRYFETGKGIDATGRTTDEFLKSLSNHSQLDDDARKSLATCLQHCDQVKFAKATLTQTERHGLTESALELIRQCEAHQPATVQKTNP